jgi:ELWxxDGT repeat protein
MKKCLVITMCLLVLLITARAQVTQINSNKSLHVTAPLNTVQTILVSDLDSSLWITDGTAESTEQLSSSIKFEDYGALIAGKFIFRGSTAATGSEIFITDGTAGGTVLVKDIYNGPTSSSASDFAVLNGVAYFTAVTMAEGRELWRTDGTNAGTVLVKDITPGAAGSNTENNYNLFSNGSYLLFAAQSEAAEGVELWRSDGTDSGTTLVKDIYAGADSSKPHQFIAYNNMVLFLAKNAANGEELWRTDGTDGGTMLVKDINPGPASCTSIELFPGFAFPVLFGTHSFNNKVYFTATDGVNAGEIWMTDGTGANTTLVKNIVEGMGASFVLLLNAVDVPGKFIFPVSDGTSRSELWQSDGTPGGTSVFKAFDPINPGDIPVIALNYSYQNGSLSSNLFQGNKFFFIAGTATQGTEVWVSDGTLANTAILKDINPGTASGIDFAANVSYIYTMTTFFFAANDGVNGNELWKTDGTGAGTTLVQDINLDAADADPQLGIVNNNKVIFSATDGDDATATDLFVVDGSFQPLPVKLTSFSVVPLGSDALLKWYTEQEINTSNFIVQRSYDAVHFENIGTVKAMGNAATGQAYEFTDAGIGNSSKKTIYYRLLITDNNGRNEHSNIVTLKLKAGSWNVQLMGNPVKDNVIIAVTGTAGTMAVAIKDITGKPVYNSSLPVVNTRLTIPAGSLPHGVYVLVVWNGNENRTVRFIK